MTMLLKRACVKMAKWMAEVPGTPLSLTFLGQLYGEAKMLALAKAYQDATDFHRSTQSWKPERDERPFRSLPWESSCLLR